MADLAKRSGTHIKKPCFLPASSPEGPGLPRQNPGGSAGLMGTDRLLGLRGPPSALWVLQQPPGAALTKYRQRVAEDRKVFSHSPGGQKSQIKASAGPCSLCGSGQTPSSPVPSFSVALGLLGCSCITPISAPVSTGLLPVCLSVCRPPLWIRTPVVLEKGLPYSSGTSS